MLVLDPVGLMQVEFMKSWTHSAIIPGSMYRGWGQSEMEGRAGVSCVGVGVC